MLSLVLKYQGGPIYSENLTVIELFPFLFLFCLSIPTGPLPAFSLLHDQWSILELAHHPILQLTEFSKYLLVDGQGCYLIKTASSSQETEMT
jgi:hypothetical protein